MTTLWMRVLQFCGQKPEAIAKVVSESSDRQMWAGKFHIKWLQYKGSDGWLLWLLFSKHCGWDLVWEGPTAPPLLPGANGETAHHEGSVSGGRSTSWLGLKKDPWGIWGPLRVCSQWPSFLPRCQVLKVMSSPSNASWKPLIHGLWETCQV